MGFRFKENRNIRDTFLCTECCVKLQEYVDYYGGAGVQHIALNTSDIITAVMSTYFIYV